MYQGPDRSSIRWRNPIRGGFLRIAVEGSQRHGCREVNASGCCRSRGTANPLRGDCRRPLGIEDIDAALERIGVTRFERLWAYDPAWEDRYSVTGINRWYTVYFDEHTDVAEVGKLLAERPGIAVVQYPIDPKYRRVMKEGTVKPYFVENDSKANVLPGRYGHERSFPE